MAAALLVGCSVRAVLSETYTWSTGTPTSIFEFNLNWTSGNTPAANSALVFGGSLQPSVVLAAPFSAFSLEFNSSYPAYVVSSSNNSTLSIGSGGVTVASGGSGSVTFDSSLPVALTANQSWTVGGTSVLTAAGGISGSGFGITKAGSGTLTLSGGNGFSGAVTISGGVLQVSSVHNGGINSGLGASSSTATNLVLNGGTLRYTGPAETIDRLFTLGVAGGVIDASGSGPLVLGNTGAVALDPSGNTSRTLTLAGTNTGSNTLSASLADSGSDANAVVKSGAGKWVLNGANTYTATTQINAGTLSLTNAGGLGGTAGGTQVGSGATLDLNGVAVGGESLTLNGTGVGDIGALTGTGTSSLTGGVTLQSNSTIGGAGGLTLSGAVGGAGTLTKAGSGTLTLSGANSYAGGTVIDAGTLVLASTGSLPTGADVTVNNSGVFDVRNNQLVRGLNSVSTTSGVAIASSTTLTTNAPSGSNTFAGVISGSGSLAKSGPATLVLSGTASSYTGSTTIGTGSALSVASLANGGVNSSIGASTSAAGNLILNGGTLLYTGAAQSTDRLFTLGSTGGTISASGSGALTLANSGAIAFSSANAGATLTLTGTNGGNNTFGSALGDNGSGVVALLKMGTGKWVLSGAAGKTYSGQTSINAGTLADGVAGSFSPNSGIYLLGGASTALNVNFNEAIAGLGGVTSSIGSTTTLASGATLTINTANLTYAGTIAGAGGLTIAGSGTQTLQGSNTYTGTTTINSGTLSISNTSALGSASGGTVVNGGTLNLNSVSVGSEPVSLSGSGVGDQGALISSSSSSLSGPITLAGSASIGGSGTLTLSGAIGESGGNHDLTKTGSGTVILTGSSSFTGQTNVHGGILRLGANSALPATTNVNIGATDNGFATFDVSNRSQTIGSLTLAGGENSSNKVTLGTGTLTLGGGVTYDAELGPYGASISSGTLALGTAGLVDGNRVVDVAQSSNAITALTIYSNISGGSTVGLTKTGSGELLLAGNSTFAGGVSVTDGKLYVGSNAAVGSGILSLASGTTLAPMQANGSFDISLTNAAVNLSDCVTLGDVNAFGSLTLAGKVMVQNAQDAVVKVRLVGGEDPVFFQNELSALNSGGTLTFYGGGKVVLGGATNAHDGNLAHLIADGAAIIFATTASVPGGLSNAVSVEATNGGYVGVAATSLASSPPSANAVLARIPNRSAFAGTFGFDTDKESVGGAHVYAEDLDFSGFTNCTFAIGSATSAVLAGRIKPVRYTGEGTYYEYRFGNGGGALVIQSNLSGNNTSVSVSSYAGQSLIAILRGNNSFTGNLRIENSAVVLDSARALPTDVFVNLYDGLAYFGATEVHSTASSFINTFYSATDYGSQPVSFSNSYSSFVPVLGLDSHVSLVSTLLGHERRFTRTISESLDFSGLSSEVYLGTLTNIDLTGALTGRYIGEGMTQLRLTGVKSGQLTVSSNLNANGGSASNVIVGAAGLGDANGVVYLRGNNAQTYTRLEGGTLLVGSNTALGIGNLDVDASDSDVRPVLASNSTAGITLANPISLTTTLQLGEANFDDHGNQANAARNKLTLSGPISGDGGLYVPNGRTILSGNNSYYGGTYVKNGVLIFASPNSIPDTDSTDMTADSSGYVGIAFTSAESGLNYTFFDHFHRNATNGTIGFDTLGDSAANEFGDIDISNFNSNVRLGSATFAKVTGTITPAGNGPYRFGGGGGLLEVSSALTNAPSSPTEPRGVVVESNSDRPLTLLLSGANTYSGSTAVNQSAVIFTPSALATVGFPATNNFSLNQGGYVGLQLTADVAGGDGTTIPGFLGHFQAGTNQGFVGFDSNSTSLRQVGAPINLSGLGAGVYLGSTSNLAVSGLLTFPGGTYRFSGYKGGQLGILSTLSGAGGVKIGEANTPATFASADGSTLSTVTLAGNNTYTGGTDFYAGRLVVGGAGTTAALGSTASPLRVQSNNFSDEGTRRLEVHSSVTAIANNIELNADLDVGGGSDFTLAGVISGLGELYKVDSNTLTLAGNNSGFSGGIYVQQGNVRLMHANAAGTGVLQMGGPSGPSVTFGVSSTVNGIFGDNATDRIYLDSGVGMTVNQTAYSQYLGTFVSNGSGTSLVFKGPSAGSPVQLRLAGSSSLFTGTTTIQGGILLVAANNSAFGPSGNVVALTGGKLAVEGDVTLSNALTLTSGKLGGAGTIEAATTLHIGGSGSNQVVLAPGVTGPGTLYFSGARLSSIPVLSLDAGGAYQWQLMDAGNSNGGWDKVVVTGSVAIGAPESGKPAFTFKLTTVASDGSLGLASFDPTVSASWKVLTATSITGSLANLAIDTAAFQNPFVGFFGLSVNPAKTELFVNFTSVPEPSTYVLLSSGLAALAFTLRRRKSPPRG